jgi:hypothetical protein
VKSVVWEEEMHRELYQYLVIVVPFSFPFCFAPEGRENKLMRHLPGFWRNHCTLFTEEEKLHCSTELFPFL